MCVRAQERDQMVGELAEARRSCKKGDALEAARPKALAHAHTHAHRADRDQQVSSLCVIVRAMRTLTFFKSTVAILILSIYTKITRSNVAIWVLFL